MSYGHGGTDYCLSKQAKASLHKHARLLKGCALACKELYLKIHRKANRAQNAEARAVLLQPRVPNNLWNTLRGSLGGCQNNRAAGLKKEVHYKPYQQGPQVQKLTKATHADAQSALSVLQDASTGQKCTCRRILYALSEHHTAYRQGMHCSFHSRSESTQNALVQSQRPRLELPDASPLRRLLNLDRTVL